MRRHARRIIFFSLICASFLGHIIILLIHDRIFSRVPTKKSLNISQIATNGKCGNERQWVAKNLKNSGSDYWITPKCTLLNFTSKTEAICENEETQARIMYSDASVVNRISDCSTYFRKFPNVAYKKRTIYELRTPLAFVIVAHSHLGLLETQLATIFRPHNAYCIFVDSKALPLFKSAVKKLTNCYREQFPQAKIVYFDDAFPVFWADISLLRADLHCIKELLKRHSTWKYLINQAGTSLPQVPVQIMAEWLSDFDHGQDSIISGYMPNKLKRRIAYIHKRPPSWDIFEVGDTGQANDALKEDKGNYFMYPERPIETTKRKELPPLGLKIFKGEREMTMSRLTIEYILKSQLGKIFWKWVENVEFPEEIFFNTLVRINKTKPIRLTHDGAYLVNQHLDKKYDYTHGICSRRTLWYFLKKNCFGMMKRHLCNLDLKDLPEVYEKVCLFINKFDLSTDSKIVSCLHEHLTSYDSGKETYS